jgi:capsular exopolysaccharide synthesis family protein
MAQDAELEEAYVALFGAMRLRRPLAPAKSILITSTVPGEGKTTTASCLAITASLAGETVLLIDGDLRRASLASAIGIAGAVGLTEILSGEAGVSDSVHPLTLFEHTSTTAPVSVMAGGRKSPMILPALDWPKAQARFLSISRAFDMVLVDSPPILAANDALLLSSIVDSVLLVIGTGSVNLDEVRRAKEQLEQSGTPLIGAVLNRFNPKIHGQSSQPYRGYYRSSQS